MNAFGCLIRAFICIVLLSCRGDKSINPSDIGAYLKITVSSNKVVYRQGETIRIDVRCQNQSAQPLELEWTSSCQSSYYIDSYHRIYGCLLACTYKTFQPYLARRWKHTHTPDDSLLGPGAHYIVGEIIGYGVSDTLIVFVGDSG